MCLYTKAAKPQIASEDIVCYKVLEKRSNRQLYTPFRYAGVPQIPYTMHANDVVDLFRTRNGKYVVESEGVHAYTDLDSAYKASHWCCVFGDPVVVRCVIPKGTAYWLGENNDIAAQTLTIEMEIKDN